MSYTFKKAVRENVALIVGLAGGTGSGKTYSAMRLASGIAGGKTFAVIDTENGRASHYADQFTFDTCALRAPFRPDAYAEAIKEADAAGYPVIVVDSASHEHAGDGGLLDWHEEELDRMAGADWSKRDACKMTAWIKPKAGHKHMMNVLLQVKAHIILCFRAEEKIEMVKENGKMVVRKKESAIGKDGWMPICEKNLPFEATCSFLLLATTPGIPNPIKLQAQHKAFFRAGQPIDEEAGKSLAQWAAGGQAQGVPTGNEGNASHKEVPCSPEPPRSLDADLLKHEFDGRLAAAQNVKELTATMNDVLDSDLPVEWKRGFEIRFKERMAAKKK